MEAARRTFIPAAGRRWTLPLYDPLVKLIGAERVRRTFIEQAAISGGHRVLDVGCGTGSLEVALGRLWPSAELVGLDPDPEALERARRKAKCAGVGVRFDQGFADALPYSDRSFDRVVSSFMFHHLGGDEKGGMLREARRVLKAGGSLHLLDFTGPGSGSDGPVARWVQSRRPLLDNAEDRILTRMREAGFQNPRRIGGGRVVFGLVPYSCFVAEVRDAS